ncbi:MAG: response regulator transcription factor [Ignavibacteriales bacterium]|nr:response regulator transcription factor [Ignavibacteriales bacterium]
MQTVNQPITLIIADDHPIFRAGLRQSIERESSIHIIDEAEDGEQALEKILSQRPGVALLDIQMPKLTGLQIAEQLLNRPIETKIILLTMLRDDKTLLKAIDLGVFGYVLKDSAVREVVKAIHTVAENEFYISSELSSVILKRKKVISQATEKSPLQQLTETERRILFFIADLKSNKEISELMFISKRTVENHRVSISKKLGVQGTNALLKFALEKKEML